MKFAIVELKYVEKKFFIVPIKWIKNYRSAHLPLDCFLCYISNDLSEEANFRAKYSEKLVSLPGLSRVFIRKITDSFEAAILFQKSKRIQTVPKKFRVPTNTDNELNAEATKQKRNEKRIQKDNKENANIKNTSHLVKLVKDQPTSSTVTEYEKLVGEAINSDCDANEKDGYKILPRGINARATQSKTVASSANDDYPSSLAIVSIKNAHKILSSPSSGVILNKKGHNQSIVIDCTKQKSPNPANDVCSYSLDAFDTQSECQNTTTANKVLPSSSSAVLLNKKGQNQSTVINYTKEKGQNSLSLGKDVKPYRTEVVAPGIINKFALSSSLAVKSNTKGQNQPMQPTTGKRNINNNTENKLVCSFKKQRVISSGAHEIVTNAAELSLPTDQFDMVQTMKKLEEENVMLKIDKDNLTERNMALQIALVACTKSMPPRLSFEEKDGGRLYNCGIFFNDTQCKILDSIIEDRQYCNAIILAVFGSDVLKASSVTGAVSNRNKKPAKPALDSTRLKFIYDVMALRTNNSSLYATHKINKIINKKISNLLAGPRKPKAAINIEVNERNKEGDYNEADCIIENDCDTEADNEKEEIEEEDYIEKENREAEGDCDEEGYNEEENKGEERNYNEEERDYIEEEQDYIEERDYNDEGEIDNEEHNGMNYEHSNDEQNNEPSFYDVDYIIDMPDLNDLCNLNLCL